MRQQETKGGTGVGTSVMVIKIIFNYPPKGRRIEVYIWGCSPTLRGIVV